MENWQQLHWGCHVRHLLALQLYSCHVSIVFPVLADSSDCSCGKFLGQWGKEELPWTCQPAARTGYAHLQLLPWVHWQGMSCTAVLYIFEYAQMCQSHAVVKLNMTYLRAVCCHDMVHCVRKSFVANGLALIWSLILGSDDLVLAHAATPWRRGGRLWWVILLSWVERVATRGRDWATCHSQHGCFSSLGTQISRIV